MVDPWFQWLRFASRKMLVGIRMRNTGNRRLPRAAVDPESIQRTRRPLGDAGLAVKAFSGKHFLDARTHRWMVDSNNERKFERFTCELAKGDRKSIIFGKGFSCSTTNRRVIRSQINLNRGMPSAGHIAQSFQTKLSIRNGLLAVFERAAWAGPRAGGGNQPQWYIVRYMAIPAFLPLKFVKKS